MMLMYNIIDIGMYVDDVDVVVVHVIEHVHVMYVNTMIVRHDNTSVVIQCVSDYC